jgi:hypothetical protein
MRTVVQLSSNIVVLSEAELWKLERLAHMRHDPKVGKVPDKLIANNDGYQMALRGVVSEYAVSLYFREPMDLFIDLHGDNNVCDLIIGNLTASVKCPMHLPPYLKFPQIEEFRQDVAVLTTLDAPNVVKLHGWTTPKRFAEFHVRRDFGYGLHYMMEPEHLYNVVSLKAIAFDAWRSNQLGASLGELV